jgi:hypothetical protein
VRGISHGGIVSVPGPVIVTQYLPDGWTITVEPGIESEYRVTLRDADGETIESFDDAASRNAMITRVKRLRRKSLQLESIVV